MDYIYFLEKNGIYIYKGTWSIFTLFFPRNLSSSSISSKKNGEDRLSSLLKGLRCNSFHKNRCKDALNEVGINGNDYLSWIGLNLLEETVSVNIRVYGFENSIMFPTKIIQFIMFNVYYICRLSSLSLHYWFSFKEKWGLKKYKQRAVMAHMCVLFCIGWHSSKIWLGYINAR